MRELIACWQHTRMIVLIGLCAAIYAAVFVMFSWLTIIPNYTQIRPGACLPVVFSMFFGPVAAWGAAFGNVLGDIATGTIGPGSLFGFVGNFVYGFAPYRVLMAFASEEDRPHPAVFVFLVILASGLCAVIISLGVQIIGIPFGFLSTVILVNNIGFSLVLGALLVRSLRARVRGMRLGYRQVLQQDQISRPLLGKGGSIIVFAVLLCVYAIMMLPSVGGSLSSSNSFLLGSSILLAALSLVLL